MHVCVCVRAWCVYVCVCVCVCTHRTHKYEILYAHKLTNKHTCMQQIYIYKQTCAHIYTYIMTLLCIYTAADGIHTDIIIYTCIIYIIVQI